MNSTPSQQYSAIVHDFWGTGQTLIEQPQTARPRTQQPETLEPQATIGQISVTTDDSLPQNRPLSLLLLECQEPEPAEPVATSPETASAAHPGVLKLRPELRESLGLTDRGTIQLQHLEAALEHAGEKMFGSDFLHYFTVSAQQDLLAQHDRSPQPGDASQHDPLPQPNHPQPHPQPHTQSQPSALQIRTLSQADAQLFSEFQERCSDDDRDEAFVELDHWLVVAAVKGNRIVCATSAYPWQDSSLVDIGVLTDPEFRGQGYGRATVRAISREILLRNLEPQYRCDPSNAASAALAISSGFTRFGTWNLISRGED